MELDKKVWGVSLVYFVAENTFFPLMFSEPVMAIELMTEFNKLVKAKADALKTEYTDKFTQQYAIQSVIEFLRPYITKVTGQHHEIEQDEFALISTSLKWTALVTTLRYFIIKVDSDKISVMKIDTNSSAEAVYASQQYMEDMSGSRPPRVLAIMDVKPDFDFDKDKIELPRVPRPL